MTKASGRKIGVVTVARSDYGIYLPVLHKIADSPDLDLQLIVAGMHLSPEFGLTAEVIQADGFEAAARVEMLLSSDTPEGIAKSMGVGTLGYAQAYARLQPDILVVLGDRFEMHAAAVTALPFKIPVAHLHGGEVTEGAMDDALRHSITKLSHLHFASTARYGERIAQLGEEPWRITVSGAPGLDNLNRVERLSRSELAAQSGLQIDDTPFLLVTFHPVTLEYEDTEVHIRELLAGLDEVDFNVIFTFPNADTQSRIIIDSIEDYTAKEEKAQAAVNLGTTAYFSLMNEAAAMVGNSSSGIIEAASFKLPVVNIGNRQRGRLCGQNVVHTGYSREEITAAIQDATSASFRKALENLVNPYGDGQAADRIVEKLTSVKLDSRLIIKRFHDVSDGES